MHGLGGSKEQAHLAAIGEAFKEHQFTVIRFDATNACGESDGLYEEATVTNYLSDLEDVIAWAREQRWFQQPFALAGHSLGGTCIALYAESHPADILALAPVSPVISGNLSVEAHEQFNPGEIQRWRATGWQERKSTSKPGLIRRLPWSHMEDRLKYDLLPKAGELTMPTLLIVGSDDKSTPPAHINQLYDAIAGVKELHIIDGAPHMFKTPEHLREIKELLSKWIAKSVL